MATTDAQLIAGCDAVAAAQNAFLAARQNLATAHQGLQAAKDLIETRNTEVSVAQGNLRSAEIALRQLIQAR